MSNYPVKFGKYLLLERVNVGGMAEVFKAKTFGVAGFERILAVKRILPNLVEDDEFIRMFIDEARIAVQLNHANIVQIYELGKHGDHYYIAMEYLPSRDLRAILDRMRSNGQLMPIPQAAYICAKVCEGLDYAHRRRDPSGSPMNIIHRDVSPQNILVGFEGEIKVIDFGIAKAANRASKTQAGVLKGKFGYMSPEQVRGLPIDRRSDIFAVGVLLYEMLTGERLFIGESDFSTLERVRNAEVQAPTTFNKKISPELENIVLKTLAREVDDRYQWASDLAEEIQPFLIEERSIFSGKRLGMFMKDTYSHEIAVERSKMEEFLRVVVDDAKSERPGASTVLPLRPEPERRPSTPQRAAPREPSSEYDSEIDASAEASAIEAEADEFGAQIKTFVIEASDAGRQLDAGSDQVPGAPPPDITGPPPKRTDPHGRDPLGPRPTTNERRVVTDESEEVHSLYGDDDDDGRTQVSAPNPFAEPLATEVATPALAKPPPGPSAPPSPSKAPPKRPTTSPAAAKVPTTQSAPRPRAAAAGPPLSHAATAPRGRRPTDDELTDSPSEKPPAKREPSGKNVARRPSTDSRRLEASRASGKTDRNQGSSSSLRQPTARGHTADDDGRTDHERPSSSPPLALSTPGMPVGRGDLIDFPEDEPSLHPPEAHAAPRPPQQRPPVQPPPHISSGVHPKGGGSPGTASAPQPTTPSPAPSSSSANHARAAAFDPVAAAMAEEVASSSSVRTAARPPERRPESSASVSRARPRTPSSPGHDVAGRQLPLGAEVSAASAPTMADLTPVATQTQDGGTATTGTIAPSTEHPAIPARVISPKLMRVLVGGVVVSFAAFVTVVAILISQFTGREGPVSEVQLTVAADGAPAPQEMTISIDGVIVARQLPTSLTLRSGSHLMRIVGDGIQTLEQSFRVEGDSVIQPVRLKSKEPPPAPIEQPPPVRELEGPELAPPPQPGWRLSLAAIADEGGAPIVGAAVLVNGRPLGTTPFEAELDSELSRVEVKVVAEGYAARAVDVARNGKTDVGPATIRLKRATTPADAPIAAHDDAEAGSEEPEVKPGTRAEKRDDERTERRPDRQAKEMATLQLGTQPFAETWIDGKSYNSTPFMGPKALKLAVGDYTVQFLDRRDNKKYRYRVSILGNDPENKLIIILGETPRTVAGKVKARKLD